MMYSRVVQIIVCAVLEVYVVVVIHAYKKRLTASTVSNAIAMLAGALAQRSAAAVIDRHVRFFCHNRILQVLQQKHKQKSKTNDA